MSVDQHKNTLSVFARRREQEKWQRSKKLIGQTFIFRYVRRCLDQRASAGRGLGVQAADGGAVGKGKKVSLLLEL